mgnify:CR=1 FL=1
MFYANGVNLKVIVRANNKQGLVINRTYSLCNEKIKLDEVLQSLNRLMNYR